MANLTSMIDSAKLTNFLNKFNPDPSNAGKTLLILNTASMIFAALSNTFAIVKDKNTSNEDKKFLVPAGLATGVANIGAYFLMTERIIKKLKGDAKEALAKIDDVELTKKSTDYALKQVKKAEEGLFGTGLFKKSGDFIQSMKETLFENVEVVKEEAQVAADVVKENVGEVAKEEAEAVVDALKGDIAQGLKEGTIAITQEAKNLYKNNLKGGASVLGAFIGAVVGCGIITPIIRDVSAYFVQKRMESKNPALKEKPYQPYFDPAHLKVSHHNYYTNVKKQPLTMKNYMAFTNGSMQI